MANTLLILEAANLFCGDHDPSSSNHLALMNLKLPELGENYNDVTAAGAPVGIEIDSHIARMEATFNLVGWNPAVQNLIGESRRERQIFTAYGAIRDRKTGKLVEAKGVMQGRLGRSNPTEFSRGQVQNHEHSIRGIVHYEVFLNKVELLYWDFFTSERRVGGVNQNADLNAILRIPNAGGILPDNNTPNTNQGAF
jgi:phage tail tube protein FII